MSNNILIFGAGKSGVGAAILAKTKGFNVLVYDNNPIDKKYIDQFNLLGIEYIAECEGTNILKDKILIVKSPGVSMTNPLILEAQRNHISIIGEIEFASLFTKAKLIGITGTNGKTTTTYLTYHILKSAGLSVSMAGNVGKSFALSVLEEKPDYFVLELSSFQLENMHKTRFDITCMLNITPDHLDRHVNMHEYINAKFRVLQNMTIKNHFIYNRQDHNISNYLNKNIIVPQLHQIQSSIDKFKLPDSLPGAHNKINAGAATTIAEILNIDHYAIQKGLNTFMGVPHRIQKVAEIDNVTFYNDSKATNIDSARVALESFIEPVIWIAGGYDKGNDYSEIKDLVKKKVKAIVCLTKDYEKLVNEFANELPVYTTQSVRDAVSKAFAFAKPGFVVLLSPACASFDLFDNYEHRGEEYMKAVHELIKLTPAIEK